VTPPIDIQCSGCGSPAGSRCTTETASPAIRQQLTFYHTERVDAAFRNRPDRRNDPEALRAALNEVLTRLEGHSDLDPDELSIILTTREEFKIFRS
jgi:hypothetical protein